MKKTNKLLAAVLFLFTIHCSLFTLHAQAPQSFNYQAVARDNSGNILANKSVSLRISLLQGSTTGASVYSETHAVSTDNTGIINIAIGGGTVVSGTFANIDWSTGTYFVKVELDATGGSTYALVGTSQLLSVPYAMYADNLNLSRNGKNWDLFVQDNGVLIALPKITVEKPASTVPSVTDASGNVYGTVKIGTQVWMDKNLMTTKYKDNTAIPLVTDATVWAGLGTPAYCNHNNTTNADTINTYGRLYNWHTVNTNNLCPTGWHVPTDADWTVLTDYLGSMAGGRMKESGTIHWLTPNTDATNDSKFTALPGGNRNSNGAFNDIGGFGSWWSATENDTTFAGCRCLSSGIGGLSICADDKKSGYSVRCLRD